MTDKTFSRRRLLKAAGLLTSVGSVGAVGVIAKSNSADANSSKFENHFDSPVGAWLFTLTPDPPPNGQEPPPFTPFTSGKVLTVINAGGTVVETELANFEERANPGMGTWVQTGKYTFEYTLLKAFLNPDGTYSSTG